ncbi:hypothetical protein V5O48_008636 [Marasmius crinis-equi]|uniref:Uncharacterized protein n=1 Tax=Marasmius crinis-equi TaxID=585013 RepID=A0ABR3FDJ4_9AGAR
MPAHRRHKTKTAQVQAVSERNKKYYEKNREALLSQKRTKYNELRAEDRKQKKAERDEKTRKEWEDVVHAEHSETPTSLAVWFHFRTSLEQLRGLEKRINEHLGFGNGSGYMERLFHEFLAYKDKKEGSDASFGEIPLLLNLLPSSNVSPLELPNKVLGAMLDTLAKIGNAILNEYGSGKEWNECKRLTLRVQYLIQSIDDFEITLLEERELGGKSLAEKFLEGELMFQRCFVSAWLDRDSVAGYVRSLDVDRSDPPQPPTGFKPLFF